MSVGQSIMIGCRIVVTIIGAVEKRKALKKRACRGAVAVAVVVGTAGRTVGVDVAVPVSVSVPVLKRGGIVPVDVLAAGVLMTARAIGTRAEPEASV